MIPCTHCQSPFEETALFCPHCGHRNLTPLQKCATCSGFSPSTAKACYHCTTLFRGGVLDVSPMTASVVGFDLEKSDQYEEQLIALYYKELRKTIIQDWGISPYEGFAEISLETTFRTQQMQDAVKTADLIFELNENKPSAVANTVLSFVERRILKLISGPAAHLVQDLVPRASVNYIGVELPFSDLPGLIAAYLKRPKLPLDLMLLPKPEEIASGNKGFYFPNQHDTPIAAFDLSLADDMSSGFVFSRFGFWWCNAQGKPHRIWYHELGQINREQHWILVNGLELSMGPLFNFPLLLLLRKLRGIYG
jgi:hypothetical protein